MTATRDGDQAAQLAGKHESWCYAVVHDDCCAPHYPMEFGTACDCGRDARETAIAAALAAERAKACEPFLALADELAALGELDGWGVAEDIRKITEEQR